MNTLNYITPSLSQRRLNSVSNSASRKRRRRRSVWDNTGNTDDDAGDGGADGKAPLLDVLAAKMRTLQERREQQFRALKNSVAFQEYQQKQQRKEETVVAVEAVKDGNREKKKLSKKERKRARKNGGVDQATMHDAVRELLGLPNVETIDYSNPAARETAEQEQQKEQEQEQEHDDMQQQEQEQEQEYDEVQQEREYDEMQQQEHEEEEVQKLQEPRKSQTPSLLSDLSRILFGGSNSSSGSSNDDDDDTNAQSSDSPSHEIDVSSYFSAGVDHDAVVKLLRGEYFASLLHYPEISELANVICMTQDEASTMQAITTLFKLLGADESLLMSKRRQRQYQQYQGTEEQMKPDRNNRFYSVLKRNKQLQKLLTNCLERLVPRIRSGSKMISAVDVMKMHKVPLGLEVCKVYLKRLFKEGATKEAMETFTNISSRDDIQLDTTIFTIMIDGHADHLDSMQQATELLTQMHEKGISEDAAVYKSLIRGFVRHGNIAYAEDALQQMRQNGFEADLQAYATLMEGYATFRNLDKAKKFMQQMKFENVHPDEKIKTALIRCYCRAGELEDAESLLSELEKEIAGNSSDDEPRHLDKRIYEDLMRAYLQKRDVDSAKQLITRVNDHYGSGARRVLDWFYIELIEFYVVQDMEEEAEQVFQQAKTNHKRSLGKFASFETLKEHVMTNIERRKAFQSQNPSSGTTAFRGDEAQMEKKAVYDIKDTLKKKNPRSALETLTRLYHSGGTFSPQNYVLLDSLMFQLKKIHDTSSIEHLISLMRKFAVPLKTKHYNMVLDAYVKREQISKAEELYQEMEKESTAKPDEFTYSSLVTGFAKAGLMDQANKYAMLLQESGAKVSQYIFTAMIDGYARLGNKGMIIRLLNQMKANGIKVNIITWTTIIKGLMDNGHTRDAMQTFMDMKTRHRINPDKFVFTVLINGFAKLGDMDHATHLFEEMLETLDKSATENLTVTYNSLINGFCRNGMMDQAINTFNRMSQKSSQAKPNVRTYTSLIDGYIRAHRMDLAMDLFDRMKNLNVMPNLHTYTLLIRELSERRRVDVAFTLYEEMLRAGIRAEKVLDRFLAEGRELLHIVPKKQFEAEKRFAQEQEMILKREHEQRALEHGDGYDRREATEEDSTVVEGPQDKQLQMMLGDPLDSSDDELLNDDDSSDDDSSDDDSSDDDRSDDGSDDDSE